MMDNGKLAAELSRLEEAVPPSEAMLAAVMGRVRRQPAWPRPRRRAGRWIVRSSIGVAAGILICAAGWLLLNGMGSEPTYADVVKAISQADSIYLITQTRHKSTWRERHCWYQRGKGAVVHGFVGDERVIATDDGKVMWRYWPDRQYAVRLPGRGPASEVLESLSPRSIARHLAGAKRDPARDTEIDGRKCRAYVKPGRKSEETCWIDADNLLRRVVVRWREEGKLVTTKKSHVRYGIHIGPAWFRPKFAPGVEVVDGEKVRRKLFGLEQAVVKKEAFGLIFAVHEVRRVEGGCVLLRCSLRPPEAMLKELGRPAETGAWAHLQMYSRRRANGRKRLYAHTEIASARLDGMHAVWYLFQPHGRWGETEQLMVLNAHVHAEGRLRRKLTAQGKPTWEEIARLATVPLPAEKPLTVAQAAEKVYASLRQLERIHRPLSSAVLCMAHKPKPGGGSTSSAREPSKITRDDFTEQVHQHLDYMALWRATHWPKSD